MIYIRRITFPVWGLLALLVSLTANTAAFAADEDCLQWDVSGIWHITQSNGTQVVMRLQQTGTQLQGHASYSFYNNDTSRVDTISGPVDGSIDDGRYLHAKVYWSNSTAGYYRGTVGSDGLVVNGFTHEIANYENNASFRASGYPHCLSLAANAPPAPIVEPETKPPDPSAKEPQQFIGTFGTMPANYQPMWVYAIKEDGNMLWYRKDSGESAWQGPKQVGNGWNFKDVIPAGGNSFYALTTEGKLIWYRHDGFNDGSKNWAAPKEVGHGWNFAEIFSGGEGIIYAITQDGKLRWYKHNGYMTGVGLETPGAWEGPKEVGTGWNGFEQVFSAGGGVIYAITQDGKLLWYKHNGYLTGAGLETPGAWEGPKEVGHGWGGFQQIVPAGGGVILAIQNDGKLRWYKHNGYMAGAGLETPGAWEGPKEVGTGWQSFRKVFALLPASSASVVR